MNNSFEENVKHLKNFERNNMNLILNIKDNDMMLHEYRNNDILLTKKIEYIYNSENIKTTTKHIICQEKLETNLQNKIELENYLNNLNNELSQDIKKITAQYEYEINVQVGLEELKLENLLRQINKEQEIFNGKEKDLRNDLELLQASMALEIDELETDMYKETVDLNMRIRQMQNINTHLQEEIDNLKQTEEKKKQICQINKADYHITTPNQFIDLKHKTDSNKSKAVKKKKSAEIINTTNENPKTYIPKKKRKLFDPDDLTYLENLELKD